MTASLLSAFGCHYPLSHTGKTQALKTLTLGCMDSGSQCLWMWKSKDHQQPMENEAQINKVKAIVYLICRSHISFNFLLTAKFIDQSSSWDTKKDMVLASGRVCLI